MNVTKDMLVMDAIGDDPEIAGILMRSGMHCLGCAMAHMESIEDACAVHGIDADALVDAINEYLDSKEA